jgi:hypothetical protein
MKKFQIEQNEKERILSLHESLKNKTILSEQPVENVFGKAVQKFLNKKYGLNLTIDGLIKRKDGRTSNTENAIMRYQEELNSKKGKYSYDHLEVDGDFGDRTKKAMPESDWNLLKKFYNEEKGFFDYSLTR